MTILLPIIVLVPVIFCLPGWLIARKRYNASPWSLNFALPGLVLWIVLAMNGIGPQSMGNVVELFYLCLGSIPAYYIKVLVIDKTRPDTRMNTIILTVVIAVAAIIMRLAMPELPE
jgi:hypothetical protein